MAEFLTDLDVRVMPPRTWAAAGGRKWELLAPLLFESDRYRGVFVVPMGFRTDFASVPRGLWNLYPKDGPWVRAAVLHDAGYAKTLRTMDGTPIHLVKRFCDDLFDEGMQVDGVADHRRRLFGAMLELFGKGAPDLVRG